MHAARGVRWGLCFGIASVMTEWTWRALGTQRPSGAALAIALGISAPFTVALSLAAAGVSDGWHRLRGGARAVALWRWTIRKGDDAPARAATAAVAVGAVGAGALGALAITSRVIASVRTPLYAAALSLSLSVLLGAVLLLVAGSLAPRLGGALARLAGRSALLRRHLGPGAIVLGALAGGAVLSGVTAARHWHQLSVVPWELALGPVVGALGATLVDLRAAPRKMGLQVVLLSFPLAAAAVFVLVLPAWGEPSRRAFLETPSMSRALWRPLRRWLDFDGDGSVSAFGETDCAPFDGSRGPHRLEVPDNGLDEDCDGHDVSLEGHPLERGKPHHGPTARLRPHLVLITTDALSHRHTTLGGYGRDVTPMLARFGARATLFEHAFSTAPGTNGAFPALFTGVYAHMVPALDKRSPPSDALQVWPATLASVLAQAGYRTHAIAGSDYFGKSAWPGITHGFEVVDTEAPAEALARRPGTKPHTSPEVTARALEVIDGGHDRPLFLWVHYFDYHPIYRVPEGESAFGRDRLDLYDTELRYADRHWGALFAAVEARFGPEEYVLAFTSDHGEVFDERHTIAHHDHCVRTEEVHVPFLIQTARRRGERVGGLVSHLDVVPTLLDLAGVPSPRELLGESLVPALEGDREPEKTVVVTIFRDWTESHQTGSDALQIWRPRRHVSLLRRSPPRALAALSLARRPGGAHGPRGRRAGDRRMAPLRRESRAGPHALTGAVADRLAVHHLVEDEERGVARVVSDDSVDLGAVAWLSGDADEVPAVAVLVLDTGDDARVDVLDEHHRPRRVAAPHLEDPFLLGGADRVRLLRRRQG